jgi:hypothetical protein
MERLAFAGIWGRIRAAAEEAKLHTNIGNVSVWAANPSAAPEANHATRGRRAVSVQGVGRR